MKRLSLIAPLFLCVNLCTGEDVSTKNHGPCRPDINGTVDPRYEKRANQYFPAIREETVTCVKNVANEYPCSHINLESFVPTRELNGGGTTELNDIWGWTSPNTSIEYALVGVKSGTSFVSLEDPNNPVVLGFLLSYSSNSIWRDIKTYMNYVFVVAEASGHGMQVFDLTLLDDIDDTSEITYFIETAHYELISTAHNIAINEESGFAYIVGGSGTTDCDGGLHVVNITDPLNPTFSACFSEQGYTHDVQCVNYNGPDTNYAGAEICFASNENQVDIVDVSDKTNLRLISTFSYPDEYYTHQGWLTEDHKYFIIDDESDEQRSGMETRSIICNVIDLENPTLQGIYTGETTAIDHNMYVKGNYVYQANYRAGLRVLDLTSISDGTMEEIAYFDVYPDDDQNFFDGAWSTYPFFESGLVIVSSIERGLFVLRLDFSENNTVKDFLTSLIENIVSFFTELLSAILGIFRSD